MKACAHICTEPNNIAGIGRDFGFKKYNVDHLGAHQGSNLLPLIMLSNSLITLREVIDKTTVITIAEVYYGNCLVNSWIFYFFVDIYIRSRPPLKFGCCRQIALLLAKANTIISCSNKENTAC